jgi:heavy metal sensor kinase
MLSERNRRIAGSTSFRLTLWYSLIFIAGFAAIFILAYALLSNSIRENNRQVAQAKLMEYAKIGQTRGLDAMLGKLKHDAEANQATGYFIRLSDSNNQTIHETVPEGWRRADPRDIAQTRFTGRQKWVLVQLGPQGPTGEIRTMLISRDVGLQVGFGREERLRLLNHFRKNALLITLPVLILGLLSGYLMARRALSPVKQLIRAFKRIDQGQYDARVPTQAHGNELAELVILYNSMLDRIENLITGLRASLDNVAHDLRTPLTRLRAVVETALASGNDQETLREALVDVAEESDRIVSMLNTLMNISEAETGVMRLNLEPLDIESLVKEAADLYQDAAEDIGLTLHVDIEQNTVIQADRNRLQQVLANLLDNTLKFTPSGGRVDLRVSTNGANAVIQVKDTGPGISTDDLPHIFDRLYRGDKSRSQRGLGLGLSLVKAVVSAHNGSVTVNSYPGQGAEFTITLPEDSNSPQS